MSADFEVTESRLYMLLFLTWSNSRSLDDWFFLITCFISFQLCTCECCLIYFSFTEYTKNISLLLFFWGIMKWVHTWFGLEMDTFTVSYEVLKAFVFLCARWKWGMNYWILFVMEFAISSTTCFSCFSTREFQENWW